MTNFAASTGHFIPNGAVLRTRTLRFKAMCHNTRPKDTCLYGKWCCNLRVRTRAFVTNGVVTESQKTLRIIANGVTS